MAPSKMGNNINAGYLKTSAYRFLSIHFRLCIQAQHISYALKHHIKPQSNECMRKCTMQGRRLLIFNVISVKYKTCSIKR